ncbi:MAG: lytic transglycosylase domain-containing protein, partial [Gemmatimonadales bacterium]
MNGISTILKSGLARNVGFAGMVLLAAVYTIPRVGSDLNSVQTALSTVPGLSGLSTVVSTRADSPSSSAGWDLPNLDNARVTSWIKLFTGPGARSSFAIWLDRMAKYEPMISAKLAERSMPQDLIYLAMIESGFNPKAQSPAKAGGLWQFISETGKRYGLTVNKRVDERNHPEKATDAALSYLSDLHDRFGSWYLAAAAYNTGENRVARIMLQVTGQEKGTDADYYRISSRLPKETQDYVPKMIAAGRISKEPAKYGF